VLISEGAVAINTLASGATMDNIYEEIAAAVAPEDQQGTSKLWPAGNKTVGACWSTRRPSAHANLGDCRFRRERDERIREVLVKTRHPGSVLNNRHNFQLSSINSQLVIDSLHG
jgi:hypothetical protein